MTQDLRGKVAVITGGTRGIGLATVRDLAAAGVQVVVASRNVDTAHEIVAPINASVPGPPLVSVMECDVSSMASVRRFVEQFNSNYSELNFLINNAGAMGMPQEMTDEGIDLELATNHMGHFLLTNLLVPALKRGAPSRIVNVSSVGHFTVDTLDKGYVLGRTELAGFSKYSMTKLCNVLFSNELGRRLEGTGVSSFAVHPGNVITDITVNYLGMFTPLINFLAIMVAYILYFCGFGYVLCPPAYGGAASMYAISSHDLDGRTAVYLSSNRVVDPSAAAQDEENAKWLWDTSMERTGLTEEESVPPLPE